MSDLLVPGRPRRQQAYRRANTSLTLMSSNALDNNMGGAVEPEPDPYIGCSNILDKFSNGKSGGGGGGTADMYSMANGSPHRKSSGGLRDFFGTSTSGVNHRSSASKKDSNAATDLNNEWSVQSVLDDLKVTSIPRQPKYSYLIGKPSQKDDFWRKSNAVSIVNNNIYSPTGSGSGVPGSTSASSNYYLPQHNSSSSKRLNDYSNNNSSSSSNATAQSTAYEDRINTALRKAPSGVYNSNYTPASSSGSGIGVGPGGGGSSGLAGLPASVSSAVQKSKSYSNFDFVRRDHQFQVCALKKNCCSIRECLGNYI